MNKILKEQYPTDEERFELYKQQREIDEKIIRDNNWNNFLEKINSFFQFIFDLFFMFVSIGTTFIFGLALMEEPSNTIIFWLFLGNLVLMIKLCYIYFKHSEKKIGDD